MGEKSGNETEGDSHGEIDTATEKKLWRTSFVTANNAVHNEATLIPIVAIRTGLIPAEYQRKDLIYQWQACHFVLKHFYSVRARM